MPDPCAKKGANNAGQLSQRFFSSSDIIVTTKNRLDRKRRNFLRNADKTEKKSLKKSEQIKIFKKLY